MQIGGLAKSAGVTVQTIRFDERKGLLPAPARRESGYRVYDATDLRRLQFVRQAQRLGFALDEIKSILREVSVPLYGRDSRCRAAPANCHRTNPDARRIQEEGGRSR